MAFFQSITSDGTHTLSNKASKPISATSVLIANKHDSSKNTIELKINDGSTSYTFLKTVIPSKTSLSFDLPQYNPATYSLELTTDDGSGATAIDVTISGTRAFTASEFKSIST